VSAAWRGPPRFLRWCPTRPELERRNAFRFRLEFPDGGSPLTRQLRHRGSELASGDTLIVNRRFVTECSRFAIPRTMRNPAWWL
jgi:hypothetical protein